MLQGNTVNINYIRMTFNKQIHFNQGNRIANNADQIRIKGERIIDSGLMFQKNLSFEW